MSCWSVVGREPLVRGSLTWDLGQLAEAVGVPRKLLLERLDGRVVGFLAELRIHQDVLKGELAPKCKGWDATDAAGQRWEIRALTERGTYFGTSRCRSVSFCYQAFVKKLSKLAGFVVVDCSPTRLLWWAVPSRLVMAWFGVGFLSPTALASRKAFLELVGAPEK